MDQQVFQSFADEIEKLAFHIFTPDVSRIWDKHEKELELARIKAEGIRQEIARKYKVSPFLAGSTATGLNKPGDFDFDYTIRVTSKDKFKKLQDTFSKTFKPSEFNHPQDNFQIYQAKIKGEDVDIGLSFGDAAKGSAKIYKKLRETLTPSERMLIVQKKVDLDNAWFMKKKRYGNFKRNLDNKLGIIRVMRERMPEEKEAAVASPKELQRLQRSDVFGHRTANLEPIIESGKLLSSATLARRGALKSYETNSPFSRERSEELPKQLRSEVFITKGLMPPSSTYGQYGIMFQKRNAEPSSYLNMIPEEHVTDFVKSKMTFIVPDHELQDWSKRYPKQTFAPESHVPKEKQLPESSIKTFFSRLLSGPRLTQKTEEVRIS